MVTDSVQIVAHRWTGTFHDYILVQGSDAYLGSNLVLLLALNEDSFPSEIPWHEDSCGL